MRWEQSNITMRSGGACLLVLFVTTHKDGKCTPPSLLSSLPCCEYIWTGRALSFPNPPLHHPQGIHGPWMAVFSAMIIAFIQRALRWHLHVTGRCVNTFILSKTTGTAIQLFASAPLFNTIVTHSLHLNHNLTLSLYLEMHFAFDFKKRLFACFLNKYCVTWHRASVRHPLSEEIIPHFSPDVYSYIVRFRPSVIDIS